jgi:indole-3-glycerol phosphate synthase
VLDTILDSTRRRIEPLVSRLDDLVASAATAPSVRGFGEALAADGLQVIAEIKRRSPSAGSLAPGMDPAAQAKHYVAGGAAAISVLTEPEFFDGSLDDLRAVREAVDVPVLRKDFTLHAAQIWEARAAGADAVLLIVAALDDDGLQHLLGVAAAAGLDALVEAHTLDEARRAEAAGARILGVNNRDLTTFVTDLRIAERIGGEIHADVLVAESGVSDPAGAARMAASGYDAILVGEALVRADDPAVLVSALKAAR